MGFKARRAVVFARSDGWLLAAAAHACRDGLARWPSIIASADYIDHAVPTYDELDGAATRLDAAGLVGFEVDGLRVSPAVLAGVDTSTYDLRRRLAAVWGMATPTADAPTALPPRLSRDAYDRAVRIHHDWG